MPSRRPVVPGPTAVGLSPALPYDHMARYNHRLLSLLLARYHSRLLSLLLAHFRCRVPSVATGLAPMYGAVADSRLPMMSQGAVADWDSIRVQELSFHVARTTNNGSTSTNGSLLLMGIWSVGCPAVSQILANMVRSHLSVLSRY